MDADSRAHEEPTESRERPRGEVEARRYRYYLEDHPVLGPVLTLVLGGACLYSTIFSTVLRDLIVGKDAAQSTINGFYTGTGWMVAFVIGIMFLSFIFLLVHTVDVTVRRVRRRPTVCPSCGTTEVPRKLRFSREPVSGTDWDTITCPDCGASWYGRR